MNTIDFTRTIGDRAISELFEAIEPSERSGRGSLSTWELMIAHAAGVEIVSIHANDGSHSYDEIDLKLTGDDLVYGYITLSKETGWSDWRLDYEAGRSLAYTTIEMETVIRDLEWATNLAKWLSGNPDRKNQQTA